MKHIVFVTVLVLTSHFAWGMEKADKPCELLFEEKQICKQRALQWFETILSASDNSHYYLKGASLINFLKNRANFIPTTGNHSEEIQLTSLSAMYGNLGENYMLDVNYHAAYEYRELFRLTFEEISRLEYPRLSNETIKEKLKESSFNSIHKLYFEVRKNFTEEILQKNFKLVKSFDPRG